MKLIHANGVTNSAYIGETANDIIINGLGYDKTTLMPKFLKVHDTNAGSVLFNGGTYLTNGWRYGKYSALHGSVRNRPDVNSAVWVSKFDPSVSYIASSANQSRHIRKFDTETGELLVIGPYYTTLNYGLVSMIIGETQDDLFVLHHASTISATATTSLSVIHKSTLDSAYEYTYAEASISQYLGQTDTYLLFEAHHWSNQYLYKKTVSMLKASPYTIKVIRTETSSTIKSLVTHPSQIIEQDASTLTYFRIQTTHPTFGLSLRTIDLDAGTAYDAATTIDWGTTNADDQFTSSNIGPPEYTIADYIHSYIVTTGTNKYVCALIANSSGTYGPYHSAADIYKLVILLIDPTDSSILTYKDTIDLSYAYPWEVYPLKDDFTHILILDQSNMNRIYTFNTSTEKFEHTETLTGSITRIGTDSLDRLWLVKDNDVYMESTTIANKIEVIPDEEEYTYEGTDISSNVNVNVYNYKRERIIADVKLVISNDSMTFAGNASQIVITSSDTADTVVPITITGGAVTRISSSIVV